MPTWLRIVVGMLVLVILAGVAVVAYTASQQDSGNYDVIANKWHGGRFIDYAGDTGVEDYHDINYWVDYDKKTVLIGYGYVQLKYTFKDLLEEETQSKLAHIGLTYDVKKTQDDFKFYWCGQEIERWYRDPSI